MDDSSVQSLPPNKTGPRTAEQAKVVARFLDGMARTNIITASCEAAGVTRPTIADWIARGIITQESLQDAFERYQDNLRARIAEMAFVGVPRPLVSGGRLVTDIEGKQVQIFQRSEKVLLAMASRLLPEFRDGLASQAGLVDDIPAEFRISFDSRQLTVDEFAVLKQVAQAVSDRAAGIIEAQP